MMIWMQVFNTISAGLTREVASFEKAAAQISNPDPEKPQDTIGAIVDMKHHKAGAMALASALSAADDMHRAILEFGSGSKR